MRTLRHILRLPHPAGFVRVELLPLVVHPFRSLRLLFLLLFLLLVS